MQKLKEDWTEGWSIQIYNSSRRLIFSLYPSHGWIFLIGFLIGFIFAAMSFEPSASVGATPPVGAIQEPLFQID